MQKGLNFKVRLSLLTICVAIVIYGNIYCNANRLSPTLIEKGQLTLDSLYSHFSVDGVNLLRENYPYDNSFKADYLATDDVKEGNLYSYLWPFSGTLSAAKSLYEITNNPKYLELIETKILPGLECYKDTLRRPNGFASYVTNEVVSDRFYDDNDWIGIDLIELYLLTMKKIYLRNAEEVWQFVESGIDSHLGGGIYWCEQKKDSKNTCSNAPAIVFALRLYEATQESLYLDKAKELYDWTRKNLRDSVDGLYFDNKKLNGNIGYEKYPYNSGQMLEGACLLYSFTGDEKYLKDANEIASSSYKYFFTGKKVTDNQGDFNLFSPGAVWFVAIMIRGLYEHSQITSNPLYMDTVVRCLDYAWDHMRDSSTGLFNEDWSGMEKKEKKWLLTQAAMVEMFSSAAKYNKSIL